MTRKEFEKLASEKCREIGMQYTQTIVNMVSYIFDNAFYTGLELGMSVSRDALKWIPVQERMPLETLRVLCLMKSNGQVVSGYLSRKNGKVCVSTDPNFEFEDYMDYEATHWFPLFGEEEV